jgi:uncharacterized membrane protein
VRRYFLPLIAGLVLGGIVHIMTTLAMPQLALDNAFTRLAKLGPANAVQFVPDPTPLEAVLPRSDPAFVTAVCRYNLDAGVLRLKVPTAADYTSVSFYTRQGLAFYSLNDHAAGQRTIELQLMTPSQRAALPEDEEITRADRLIVESPTLEGVVLVRAFVREPGNRTRVRERIANVSCAPEG